METNKKISFISAMTAFIFLVTHAYSQTGVSQFESEAQNPASGAALFLIIAFALIMIFILVIPKFPYSRQRMSERLSFLKKISQVINKGVPVEKEKEIMMDHNFDGIYELNNKIPPWFNVLFYGTIIFALVYFIDYHVLGSGNIMIDEYVQEVRDADQKREELIRTGAFINENNVSLITEPGELEKGRQIFTTNCVVCHGPDAGGTVGPNLTDEYWIHGGGIKNVFTTVKNGVPVKGMIAWKTMLNPKQMQQVSSYVLSLQGTKPSIGKPPEGNKWIETDSVKIVKDTMKVSENSIKK